MNKELRLIRDIVINPFRLPEDFEDQILKAFKEFTSCTAKDYRFHDKLHFIDVCVQRLNGNKEDDALVERLICEATSYNIRELGTIPDSDEFLNLEFMEHCVAGGRNAARLYAECEGGFVPRDTKCKILDRILKALYSDEADRL